MPATEDKGDAVLAIEFITGDSLNTSTAEARQSPSVYQGEWENAFSSRLFPSFTVRVSA